MENTLANVDEKERLREKALEAEAIDLGREQAQGVRKQLISGLSARSVDRYNLPTFKSMADRDLFVTRFRSAFEREFQRSLGD